MNINAWFKLKQAAHDEIISALEDEELDPGIFAYMADQSVVGQLFKTQRKAGTWLLWSVNFDFPDDDQYEYPVVDEPELPELPEAPVRPVENVPTMDAWEADNPAPEAPTLPEEPTEQEVEDYNAAVEVYREAMKDWREARAEAQSELMATYRASQEYADYLAAMRLWRQDMRAHNKEVKRILEPWRKEVRALKAEVRKQGNAWAEALDRIQNTLGDTRIRLLGAWFWDGGIASTPANEILDFMPDVFDGLLPNGDPKYLPATEPTDVNLIAGQHPRDFD